MCLLNVLERSCETCHSRHLARLLRLFDGRAVFMLRLIAMTRQCFISYHTGIHGIVLRLDTIARSYFICGVHDPCSGAIEKQNCISLSGLWHGELFSAKLVPRFSRRVNVEKSDSDPALPYNCTAHSEHNREKLWIFWLGFPHLSWFCSWIPWRNYSAASLRPQCRQSKYASNATFFGAHASLSPSLRHAPMHVKRATYYMCRQFNTHTHTHHAFTRRLWPLFQDVLSTSVCGSNVSYAFVRSTRVIFRVLSSYNLWRLFVN